MDKKELDKLDEILGISLEKRQELQQKIIEEMDDEWESELNRQKAIASLEFHKKHQALIDMVNIDELINISHSNTSNSNIVLSPAEILLLKYINGRSTDLDYLPGYFTYEYKIDYKNAIEKMFTGKYLTFAPVPYSLSKQTLPQLKNLLKEYNLKTNGKKAELITRIIENIPPDALKNFENQYFQVTDKGMTFIDNNTHIHYFHSIYSKVNISVDEADRYRRDHPTLSEVEIGLDILDKRLKYELSIKNYGLARNICYNKAELCFYGHKKEQALGYYCLVCYLDKTLSEKTQLHHPDFPTYASGIVSSMKMILQSLGINKEELREICRRNIHRFLEENDEYDLAYFKKDEDEMFDELSGILNCGS